MEKEKLIIERSKFDGDNNDNVLESLSVRCEKTLSIFDSQKEKVEDGGRKIQEKKVNLELLRTYNKDFTNPNGLEMKLKVLDKKGPKQVKAKIYNIEKEPSSQPIPKVVSKKNVDFPSLEGLRDMESDRKVHESLDTFIRQTMGREPYMSFTSRPGEKPLQRIIEHQQAMNKCVKNLKVDIDIRDGLEENTNTEPHQVDIEKDPFGTKGGSKLGRGLQTDKNLQTIKSIVPQAVVAFATTKNIGKQNPSIDHLTDLPSWPLLSPSKVQLQKCEKCSREFFSPFNHRRHTRTHRRISHVDKEDLTLKRKNVAAFWDKLNQDEVQQIFVSSQKYDLEVAKTMPCQFKWICNEFRPFVQTSCVHCHAWQVQKVTKDISGEALISHLLAFKKQNNPLTLPSTYLKAGQDLLDMLDIKQVVFPLFSEQIFSILDEASENTFLCSQGDVSKAGLEEKNMVATLGFIVEQTLVKAWMADKDAEALRNQQELVKEEEAAQMKRERIVAKKKKKKEKSRQKGLKERKGSTTQLALNEENESIDEENPSPEIVEEDNSPTASSTSINSSGQENPLLEHLEMEVNYQVQNANGRLHIIDGEGSIDDQLQHCECDLAFHGKEEECSVFLTSSQVKVEDQGCCNHNLEQDQNVVESSKSIPLKPFREPIKIDYQDSYQRGGWVADPRFQEGIQQNSYKMLRKPLIGTSYTSNIELGSNFVPGFYRGKPANLRGTTTFPTTQQWAKKAQTPATSDHGNKDGHEDENSQEFDAFTDKNNTKDAAIEHTPLAPEINIDPIGNISRPKNEEFKTLEKKEPLPPMIPSVAKVVASSGSLSNIQSASFNLNVNLEDWPPLSNSHAVHYPKNVGIYSLASSQYEVNSRFPNKCNVDKGYGHQVVLESKSEESIGTTMPIIKGLTNEPTIGPTTTSIHKGIMIGSVTVPLGDFVHPSKLGLGSISRRIGSPLHVHQSYTAVLAAPPIHHTRDPMASIIGQQKIHNGTNTLEFDDSSNMQIIDSYGSSIHFRSSSLRSTPCMNLNIRHIRGPTYLLGDRGERSILLKQASSLSGPIRHLSQKVWRPIRSINESANPNPLGGTIIESESTVANEKEQRETTSTNKTINIMSSQDENKQVQEICTSKLKQCFDLANDSKAQVRNQNCILETKHEKKKPLENATNYNEPLILNSENLQTHQETNEVASIIRVDSGNMTNELVKIIATEQNTKCIAHDKKNNTKKMDDKAYMDPAPSHSIWIAEAIEFHLSRWKLGLEDPETIVSNCEEEHHELQTSKWIDFLNNLPSIATKLNFQKEDSRNSMLKTPNNNDQIGSKNSKNLFDEQRAPNIQKNNHKSSRQSFQAILSSEELQGHSLTCESGSPLDVCIIPIGPSLGLQNHGKGDNEGRIESRCGSSCSDSSMSSNSQSERRDWIGTINTIHERPQEKKYIPK